MRKDATATVIGVLMFAYVLSIGPAVYETTLDKQWDTPILYRAGRGEVQIELFNQGGQRAPGWVWSDRLLPAVGLWAKLDYPAAFAVVHAVNALGLGCLVAGVLRRRHRYPYLAWTVALGIGYLASDTVATGNLSAMLAGASVTPIGALLVCCVKPWFGFPFVLLHAVVIAGRGGQGVLRIGCGGAVAP